MAVGAVVARILSQYSDKGSKAAQKDIQKLGKNIDAFGRRATKSFALVGAATAAYAIKLGVDAVKGAAADEKQQAALAIALRNTTGATDAAIAANLEYLDSLELQVAIDNEKLIPALQKLVTATGDLGEAQGYLSLATDVSVASGLELNSVATIFTRALGGNVDALKKLRLPLDKTALKTKDLTKLFGDLAKVSQGQAAAAANTFEGQVTKLGLAFNQVKDIIGLALLPGLTEFVNYLDTVGIKKLEEFVNLNKDKLADALDTTVANIKDIAKAFENIYNVIDKINNILPIGIGGYIQIAAAIKALSIVYGILTVALGVYTARQVIANAATQTATVSSRALLSQIVMNSTGYTANAAALALINKNMIASFPLYAKTLVMLKAVRVAVLAILPKPILVLFAAMTAVYLIGQKIVNIFKKQADEAKNLELINRSAHEHSARISADAKKRADAEAAFVAQNKINAAIELANAQKAAAAEKIKLAAEKLRLGVLKEIAKFGVKPGTGKAKLGKGIVPTSTLDPAEQEAIQFEAARLNLVKQGNLAEAARIALIAKSREAVVDLAKAWGGTKEQVEMYGDFVKYLNDGKLSDAEIVKLQEKWGLSSKQVQIYADIITKASDKIISDAEIIELGTNWGLTTKEVLEYIKKIGQPVIFSGTLVDPALLAALGWKDALDALLAYRKALTGEVSTGGGGSVTSGPIPGSTQVYPGDFGVGGAVGEGIEIATEAMIEQFRAAEAASTLISGSSQVYAGDFGDGGVVGGFTGSPTMNNALGISGIGSSDSGVVVNLTVNGSVTTENDLISTIRNGLLRGQYNGQGLALAAI